MRCLFVCKASEKTGLGHLIRSRSLARYFSNKDSVTVDFLVIEQSFERLFVGDRINYSFSLDEASAPLAGRYDFIFLDMLSVGDTFFKQLRSMGTLVLLSPVFNRMADVDIFFNRTSYHPALAELASAKKFLGAEYSIISDECVKIPEDRYRENISVSTLPIAISMGGGDAKNKTLDLLKVLKNCKTPVSFWVLLGEGYSHSYDELVKEVTKDTRHEIILVRTNRHMWHVMQNCALGIFPGGITVYEAAFVGLPSLIVVEDDAQHYLVRELEQKGVCLSVHTSGAEYEKKLVQVIDGLFEDRSKLLAMHRSSTCIDGKGRERIFEVLSAARGASG